MSAISFVSKFSKISKTGLKLCKYMPGYKNVIYSVFGTYCDEKCSSCRHDFLSSGVPISLSLFSSVFSLGFFIKHFYIL